MHASLWMSPHSRRFVASIAAAVVFGTAAASCAMLVREPVLRPGQTVTCTNKFGTIKISYVSPTKRRFEFDGHKVVKNLQPRMERFMGELGLEDPGQVSIFAKPTYRLIVVEAQKHFDTYEQVYKDLYSGSEAYDWVYTNDGLMCGYAIERPKESWQFPVYEVELYQIYVGDKKPTKLKGSRDSNIQLESRSPS